MWIGFFIGFAIGIIYGSWLFWQGLKEYDELYQQHMDLLREMQRERLFRQSEN